MDQSVKTLINLVVIFIGMMLLMSCVSFFLVAAHARSVLYSVTQYVEIYGNDTSRINDYADATDTAISIVPIDVSPAEGYRYQVNVSFSHIMAIFDLRRTITYSSMTRIINY